jgi:hypothetical protein
MHHINNVMARNGAMFEQGLTILLQTNNLLLVRFQLVSELSEGISISSSLMAGLATTQFRDLD